MLVITNTDIRTTCDLQHFSLMYVQFNFFQLSPGKSEHYPKHVEELTCTSICDAVELV
jgi:hypothetical protein